VITPSATPNDRPAIVPVGKPSRPHRASAIADRWIAAPDHSDGAMRSPNCSPCRPNTPPGATPCPTAFRDSATAEALQAIVELDLDVLADIELPLWT
jgi:hypothetical protein